jgi:hypothetical protein
LAKPNKGTGIFLSSKMRQPILEKNTSTPLGQALADERLEEIAADVGQAEVAALKSIGQLGVFDTELMQEGGVEVVDVYRVFLDAPADLV